MNVYVDMSEVYALERDAVAALKAIPSGFREAGREAARRSRDEHAYINRTFNTQRKTQALVEVSGINVYMNIVIDVPHASYLMAGGTKKRGASLTAMESAIDSLKVVVEYIVDGAKRAAER